MTTRQRDDDHHDVTTSRQPEEAIEDNIEEPHTKRPKKRHHHHHSSSSAALWDIPTSSHYEVSYMHRKVVTRVCHSQKHGYVLTASEDGIVKFWKRVSTSSSETSGTSTTTQTQEAAATNTSNKCLEFVKSFTAHVGPVLSLVVSASGDTACSVGQDGILKLYDVSTFDVTGMIQTKTTKKSDDSNDNATAPAVLLGMHTAFIGEDLVATTSSCDNQILIYDLVTLSPDPIHVVKLHAAPITAMAYNTAKQCMVSADQKGVLELWNGSVSQKLGSAPSTVHNGISWKNKMDDTQLYELMRKSTFGVALAISSPHNAAAAAGGNHFCVYGADRKIRLYEWSTCRIVVTYDERPKVYDAAFTKKKDGGIAFGMDAIEYGKRAATEREINDTLIMTGGVATPHTLHLHDDDDDGGSHALLSICFDDSGKFLLIPTLLGIKCIDWKHNRVVKIIGKQDASHVRFISICLCSGDAKVDRQMQLARSGGSSAAVQEKSDEGTKKQKSDALLIALAYKKRRLYVLSHNDPLAAEQEEESDQKKDSTTTTTTEEQNDILLQRDVLNEPPDAEDRLLLEGRAGPSQGITGAGVPRAGTQAILRTTMGDIHIKLFANEVPRTIENFCTHATNGYYDNVIFHRIIKGFMIQTGDPLGDGTGGESIWGGEFEDEFVRDLRHDRPFTVSMANAGPNTNGSQFFITTVPTPWLDNKHTVFGRVTKGMDVCSSIESVKTDDMDKPLDEINILSIDIL